MSLFIFIVQIIIILILNLLAKRQCNNFKNKYLQNLEQKINKSSSYYLNYFQKIKAFIFVPCLAYISLYLLVLALLGSFEYATLLSCSLFIVLFVISFLKFNVLKEPIVWTDFSLIIEMFISPRFYFAYVKGHIWGLIAIAVVFVIYILSLLPFNYLSIGLRFCSLIAAIILLAITYTLLNFTLCFNSLLDGIRISPLSSLLQQIKEARKVSLLIKKQGIKPFLDQLPSYFNNLDVKQEQAQDLSDKKHIILIQAESYCSLSRMGLDHSHRYMEEDNKFIRLGCLDINYLGAYTMRSEFSALTGIEYNDLGIYAYDPYLLAKQYPIQSLASLFKQQGYKTICIHPNNKRFFARYKVMQNLGFDTFLSIEDMPNLSCNGHNISDQSLLEFAQTVLNKHYKDKVFMFIITMETHGPWKLDKKNQDLLQNKTFDKHKIALDLYNMHIASLDTGINKFVDNLTGNSSMVLYGDHLPSIELILNSKALLKPDIIGYNLVKDSLQTFDTNDHLVTTNELFKLVLRQGVKDAKDNV